MVPGTDALSIAMMVMMFCFLCERQSAVLLLLRFVFLICWGFFGCFAVVTLFPILLGLFYLPCWFYLVYFHPVCSGFFLAF
jgi:hypothetical protein